MELKIARNVDEYLNVINDSKSKGRIWFRGMSKADYMLTPSLFRGKRKIGTEYSGGRSKDGEFYRKSEAIMKSDTGVLEKFKSQYDNLFPEKSQGYNLIDYLYIMQHYDIPTRLLDFSTNELIALYFSVAKDSKSNGHTIVEEDDFKESNGLSPMGSVVHCINPSLTNAECYGTKGVLNIDHIDDVKYILNLNFPLCVTTNNDDSRIKAQSGVFMLYGREYLEYDARDIFIPEITKVFIPNSCRREIKNELRHKYDVYHSTVFPDLKGISMDILDDIECDFETRCKKVFGD